MRHSFKKISLVLMVLLCISAAAFANANSEKSVANDNTELQETHTEKAVSKAMDSYKKEVESFNEKYNELKAKLELAYDKNDAVAYSAAKQELKNLEYPYMTEEKSKDIEAELKDDDFETANWLYQNSRYYHPVLKLVSSKDNYSYTSNMTANPGSDVSLPEISGPSKAFKFEGWGLTEDKVTYAAGSTIKMPVKDVTLYAVFSADPSIKEGKSLEIKDLKGLSIKQGKQSTFEFTVKNSGTETLKGLKIAFESDDPLFVILTDSLSCRYLATADEGIAKFRVISKAAVGTQLKGLITITDSQNETWTEEVLFTVE